MSVRTLDVHNLVSNLRVIVSPAESNPTVIDRRSKRASLVRVRSTVVPDIFLVVPTLLATCMKSELPPVCPQPLFPS